MIVPFEILAGYIIKKGDITCSYKKKDNTIGAFLRESSHLESDCGNCPFIPIDKSCTSSLRYTGALEYAEKHYPVELYKLLVQKT